MSNTYSETIGENEKRLHVLGYLAGDMLGIGAGCLVGKLLMQQFGNSLVAMIGGLVCAAVVAGAIVMLVCYLAGKWEDEVIFYLGQVSHSNKSTALGQVSHSDKSTAARHVLKTNRGVLKYILFSLLTFNIYGIIALTSVGRDINKIAEQYDGKKTMNYCLIYFLFTGLTLGIAPLVWHHRMSARIGRELSRRGIAYNFDAGTFWVWNLIGLFIAIGPFVYMHKLFKAMNLLSADYNTNG